MGAEGFEDSVVKRGFSRHEPFFKEESYVGLLRLGEGSVGSGGTGEREGGWDARRRVHGGGGEHHRGRGRGGRRVEEGSGLSCVSERQHLLIVGEWRRRRRRRPMDWES